MVETLPLQHLLHSLPPSLRIELLKIDVQGNEWPCIESASHLLHRVDNLFIEVEDGATQIYIGALNVSALDDRLAAVCRRFKLAADAVC